MIKSITHDDAEMTIKIDTKKLFSGRAIDPGGFAVETQHGDFAATPKVGEEIARVVVRILWPPEPIG
jgi:hypothetical protein